MTMKKSTIAGIVTKKATIVSAYCDATRNTTVMTVHDEDNANAYTLVVPTASEKRLKYLTNGKKVQYTSDLSTFTEYEDGRKYLTTYAQTVKFC